MRKLNLMILMFLLSMSANHVVAQQVAAATKKRPPIEVRLGFTFSNFDTPYDNETRPSSSKSGLYVGAILDYPLSKSISFEPGLVLTSKGGKLDANYVNDKAVTVNGVYLQAPLYFSFKLPLRRYNNALNFDFGPYVAYGIYGQTKYKPSGSYASLSYDSFGSQGPLNRLDIGLSIEFQFEFKRTIVFTLGSEGGMTRSMKKDWVLGTSDLVANSTGYLSVGYKF